MSSLSTVLPLVSQQIVNDSDAEVKANDPRFYPALKKIAGLETAWPTPSMSQRTDDAEPGQAQQKVAPLAVSAGGTAAGDRIGRPPHTRRTKRDAVVS